MLPTIRYTIYGFGDWWPWWLHVNIDTLKIKGNKMDTIIVQCSKHINLGTGVTEPLAKAMQAKGAPFRLPEPTE